VLWISGIASNRSSVQRYESATIAEERNIVAFNLCAMGLGEYLPRDRQGKVDIVQPVQVRKMVQSLPVSPHECSVNIISNEMAFAYIASAELEFARRFHRENGPRWGYSRGESIRRLALASDLRP